MAKARLPKGHFRIKKSTPTLCIALAIILGGGLLFGASLQRADNSDAAATITTITPNKGPTAGGTTVTITGTDLGAPRTPTFDETYISGTSETITVPADSYDVTVEVWAAGGGGGGSAAWFSDKVNQCSVRNFSGGGGGSGAYSRQTYAGPISGNLVYTVGAGGARGANILGVEAHGGSGAHGGSSSAVFGSITISADGGSGGNGPYIRDWSSVCANTDGAGGVGGLATYGSGAVRTSGNNGGNGSRVSGGGFSPPYNDAVPAAGPGGAVVAGLNGAGYGAGGSGCGYLPDMVTCTGNPPPQADGYDGAVRVFYYDTPPTMTCFAPTVKVDGAALAAGDVAVNDDCTELTLTMPAHAAGTVDITVDNGVDVLVTSEYTYYGPMTIDDITPGVGPTTGGTVVEIRGDFPESIPKLTLQEMTQEYCESMPIYDKTNPNPASTVTLKDARNGQRYDIRRLQDGNCWMIDNLKLELTNGMELTPADTNVVNNTTVWFTDDGTASGAQLPNMTGNFTTSKGLTVDGSNTPTNADAWRQADPSNIAACKNNVGTISGVPYAYDPTSETGCGYLYNHYTATAGTVDSNVVSSQIVDSICPAGWRLPSAGTGSNGTVYGSADLTVLNASMNANVRTTGATTNSFQANWWPTGSFRGSLAGYYNNGFSQLGGMGQLWTATRASSGGRARYASFNANIINLAVDSGDGRQMGLSVRCVTNNGSVAYNPITNNPLYDPEVTFDGVPATNVSVSDDRKTIYATTPAHATAAYVDVVVDNGFTAATLKNGFVYYSPLIINKIEPNNGLTAGNTTVKITGSGFDIPTLPAPTTMQEMSQAYCRTMAVGDTLTLPDARDSQNYDIRKLADNNCWMISNLKLGSASGTMTLTDADTDLTNKTSYTLPQLNNGSDTSQKSDTTPFVYGPSPADNGQYGYYYNWTAAIAEDDSTFLSVEGTQAANSVCPSGWRLARGGLAGDPTNEYDQLNAIMAGFNGNQDPNYAANNYGDMYYADGWISNSSFRSILSGTWNGTLFDISATTGSWWSSTVGDTNYARTLHIVQNYMADTETLYSRYYGIPVRCMSEGGISNAGGGGLAVEFDGLDVNQIVSSSDSEIIVRTPAHTAGLVDVAVDNGLTGATKYGSYFYYDPMTVTDITPNHGPTAGGTAVTVTGTNFAVQPATWTQVAAGAEHTLALDAGGNLFTWGGNTYGQIGNGVIGGANILTPYQIDGKYIYVAAGQYHSIAIDTDGQLWTWGYNGTGQVGNGTSGVNADTPQPISDGNIPPGTKFVMAAAGMSHSMALTENGDLYVWGGGAFGQLGNGTTGQANSPQIVPGGLKFATMSSTNYTNLAITTDGDLYAWGSNDSGQIGNGGTMSSGGVATPYLVVNGDITAGMKFRAVASGGYHSMALDMAGNLYTWGRSGYGALGNGSSTGNIPTPHIVNGSGGSALSSSVRFTDIAAGLNHSLATTPDGQVYIWGYNSNSQLGSGTIGGTVFTPQLLTGGDLPNSRPMARIVAGLYHTMVTDNVGQLYIWGQNDKGQIGTGAAGSDISSPRQLGSLNLPFYVFLDSTACTNIVITNSTSITCNTPAHSAGWVDVKVDNSVTSATKSSSYLYYDLMTLSDSTPKYGLESGGTTVTITGANITPPVIVPTTMQQMTRAYCATMPIYPAAGSTISLTDARNNQTYDIRRLQDGNCWMIDNLKIANYTATSSDTNLTSGGFNIPALTTSGFDLNNPKVYGPVTNDGSGDTNYGYLYNWPAATAGETTSSITSGNATSSICPANWHLPTSNEFLILNGSMYNGVLSPADGNGNSAHAANWQYGAAFSGVFSGNWEYDFNNQGSFAGLWSSTSDSNEPEYASVLNFSSSGVGWGGDYRDFGFAVRCMTPGEPLTVTFDTGASAVQGTVTAWDDDSITVITPVHSPGLVSITVSNGVDSVTLPAICTIGGTPTPLSPGDPLPDECNGRLDSGESRNGDRANAASGFLYEEIYISLSLDNNLVQIGGSGGLIPASSGVFGSGGNILTTSTNNPRGYSLFISTNELSTNPNAKDLKHVSLNQFVAGTGNTCSWNNTTKVLTNTSGTLANNTWGFTTNSANLLSQQLCQVPAKDNLLTIKSTSLANEAGDPTSVFFGAKVDMSKPSGKYQTIVVYTAVAET